MASLWWAIALGIVWALVLGWLFGVWLYRVHAPRMHGVPASMMRATSYFSGAIGAASEMTLLAERENARTDLVAASHSLRLLIVTVTIPFALQWSGLHGLDILPPTVRAVSWPGLALLAVLTGAGALVMERLGRANPWFMGALVVSMGLAMAGVTLSARAAGLVNAAQLVIGVSLGVRFRADFLRTAPRWLATVAGGTLVLMGVCALFAWLLARGTGLPWVTLLLGTSPGNHGNGHHGQGAATGRAGGHGVSGVPADCRAGAGGALVPAHLPADGLSGDARRPASGRKKGDALFRSHLLSAPPPGFAPDRHSGPVRLPLLPGLGCRVARPGSAAGTFRPRNRPGTPLCPSACPQFRSRGGPAAVLAARCH